MSPDPPDDDLQRRFVAFVRAFGLHRPEQTPCGAPVAVSEAHALSVIDEHGPLPQNNLAHHLQLAKSTVSRMLDQLERRGWVQRSTSDDDLAERQAEVAQLGADVMPFDLDATTHRFEPIDDGLVQTVVADDPNDGQQVSLVREHLAAEAERFANGDYSDPASIHGEDMPGLAELEAGASAIAIELEDVTDGARITYTTDDPALIDALHRWAQAQVTDHGEHAERS